MLTDDQLLVRRMVAGDAVAFEAFFDAYFQRLFRFAVRRLGDADAAEDAVQQTLAIAVRKLHTWRGEAALFTWLCTICRREVGRIAEQEQRRPLAVVPDDDAAVRAELEALVADVESPQMTLERAEVSHLVQITLDYLPGRYGDILEWKYAHGLSVAEIAARLESTPKAVESMLARARDAFRAGFTALSRTQVTHDA